MTIAHGLKIAVKDFWNRGSCGEVYATGTSENEYYDTHAIARYDLEPYIRDFARFSEGKGKDVLEIGVGMGADHVEWARSRPNSLTGLDLTPRAIEHTKKRLDVYGLPSQLQVADAELMPFKDNSFDVVYSYGVLHHSPDTQQAINEVFRVLRPGGSARIMIYQKYSITGYILWLRYGLLRFRPQASLEEIYSKYLESPGTKAFSVADAKRMFSKFSSVSAVSQLSFGDLLQGSVGQRHRGVLLEIARRVWPRALIRRCLKTHGLLLLIEATK
jgi:ubiquinone/menaquinone biosynthesis C-methylase UbiE